jgi:integrase/recombinase XerD
MDAVSLVRYGTEKIMRDPSRVRVEGPLAPYVDGFRVELAQQGYSGSTVAQHLRLMGHLSRWLAVRGLDGRAATPELVGAYLVQRRAAGYASLRSRRGLAPLLDYLRRYAGAPRAVPVERNPVERVLLRYARFLQSERGLVQSTIRRNVELVRPFLTGRVRADGDDLCGLTAGDVAAFVTAACQGPGRATASRMATALRSLLRFLHVEGLIDRPLVEAVPPVAAWKLAGLPKTLRAEQVSALLATCDQDCLVGRRDFAILTLLVRLGLRAGEVAALRLDDIDWRRGEITVRGKGNRHERLPLPVDVGHAVASYLRADARVAAGREVFTRLRAPHGPMTSGAVTQMVASRGRRAGFGPVYAHRLRHTAATGMLRAGGTLSEIGQVLRHRHVLTTAIYAKTDLEGLRTLARPWPVGTP